jgi:crotonobetainyl-CoA:carnitine CoA-transferase CaiB-like acyl-CoA transferase
VVLGSCRILEACHGRAGRLAGVFLAELGADVAALDGAPLAASPGEHLLGRSKWNVATADVEVLRELAARADVVICDFADARRRDLGLDEDALRRSNPGVVLADVTPYGRAGAFVGLPEDSQLAAALAGQVGGQWSHREGGAYSVPDFGSHVAGMQTVAAVLGALYGRAVDGHARTTRTSLLAGWLAVRNVHAVTGQNVTSVSVRDPQGGMTPVMRLYRTGDRGWLILSCSTDQFWGKLCIALGRPELTADPRFEQAPFGIAAEHKPALVKILSDAFASGTRDEWIARLRSGDVPCAPVQSPEEALRDAQLEANGGVVTLEVPGVGTTRQIASLVRFTRGDVRIRHAAHEPGADTAAVCERWARQPAPAGELGVTETLPFAGVRVLEICDWVAGPAAGNTLRQLGAEVWKIEAFHGDAARFLQYVYLPMNCGKSLLRVDLRAPEGRAILERLMRTADVVIHNHRPQRARELGFDAESAHAIKPKLVHHEIYSFGPDGPLAGDPAFDQLVAARTGLAWLQGGMSDGNPPVLHNCSCGDLPAGIVAVAAVAAGLLEHQATGQGTRSWSTLLEAGYLLNWSDSIHYDGRAPQLEGGVDFLGPDPAHRIYRTADDWVLVSANDDSAWACLARLVSLDLGTLSDAQTEGDGRHVADLERAISRRSSAEWEELAVQVGAPLVALRRDATVSAEPHVSANGYEARGRSESGDTFSCPGYLVQVAGQAPEGVLDPPDPRYGAEVILGAIGMSAEEIDDLAIRGIVAGPVTGGAESE